ncbi:hypothetical protein MPER_09864 [Moniliophthora perniciosa FA553]|nr:hypothetical protein MPER_09864 [Moniliophthora perniciosa FA553]
MPGRIHNSTTLSEAAQSLHDYLDPHAQTVHFPSAGDDDLSDAMKQMAVDMEKMSVHADVYEEAAVIVRKKTRHMQSIFNAYKNSLIPLWAYFIRSLYPVGLVTYLSTMAFDRVINTLVMADTATRHRLFAGQNS